MNEQSTAAIEARAQYEAQKKAFWDWFHSFFTIEHFFRLVAIILTIFIMWGIYRFIVRLVKKIPPEKTTLQRTAMVQKCLRYAFNIIVAMYILSCFGIKLSALLGAAGIVGLAVGFAAQTTASNLISGLFVITEGSIRIGDVIIIDGITGVVDSLDLLATKIHTLDNQMIRIPNSKIIDSNFQNNSYFAQRRVTIPICVKYGTDIQFAIDCFLKVPAMCPTVLKNPEAKVWVDEFADNNINMTLAVWCKSTNYLPTKNAVFIALQKIMTENHLDMSYNVMELVSHDDIPLKTTQA